MGIASAGSTTTNVVINIHDLHLLGLVTEALAAKGLALRVSTISPSTVFYGVGPDDATLAEAAARTAAAGND